MNRPVAIAASALIFLAPCGAFATNFFSVDDLYVRLDSGYSWSRSGHEDLDGSSLADTPILGLGVGYVFGDHLRLDLTLGYRGWYYMKATVPSEFGLISQRAEIQALNGMVNVYYDIYKFEQLAPYVFTPYVGAGVGFVYNNFQTTTISFRGSDVGTIAANSRTNFAWQVGVGTSIDVAPHTAVDLGYRYLDMGRISTSDHANIIGFNFTGARTQADLRANELQVGLRYRF